MKLRIIFAAAIFVVGIAASMALAAPKDDGNTGSTPTQTTSSTGDPGHGHHKGDGPKGPKAPKPHCHELNLKGTLADGSLSLTVEKANHGGKDLVGTSVSVAVGGEANLHLRVCDAGAPGANGATGYQLRSLKMAPPHPGKPGGAPAGGTTTSTTTTNG